MDYSSKIATELGISEKQAKATIELFNEGATIPFIARYRKEATGSLDEVVITNIRERLNQLIELDKRREAVLTSIDEQGKLSKELKEKILQAQTLASLEDMYLPYRPKRRTRATIAKEKGLEPLAKLIFEQSDSSINTEAAKYISKENEVNSIEDAIAGAKDIIAEWISEDSNAREAIRQIYRKDASFKTKVIKDKEDEAAKYKDYFDWTEPVATAPSHRILAMRRGAKEKFLTMRIEAPLEKSIAKLEELFVTKSNEAALLLKEAILDSFKRLLSLSMETEIRMETKKRADQEAIRVFAENLRQLLLAAPMGQKRILALDPGFRTGCKLVCLDAQGKLIHNDTVYPHTSKASAQSDAIKIKDLCRRFKIEAIAIGNGTASRETLQYVRNLGLGSEIEIVMVSESGASIYSASEAAREEFPDYDLTVRGAVSIGRRLMDPLAELVKIDAKSIGVGQYQHDVDQKKLKNSLDDTVISCVNNVGVEINTASKQLLTYVSGVGPTIAEKIVSYRNKNGRFNSRKELLEVSGLGAKCFEQCAGFLKISKAKNPLDASSVHPEAYYIVEKMAADLQCSVQDLMAKKELRKKIKLSNYVDDTIGLPTLTDIMAELEKPGRDPREKFESFSFSEQVNDMSDLEVGMKLPGIVTNITAFGAFVDVGVHQDGLVHISQISDGYVKDPADIVKVHQKVNVTVTEVDINRKRIALSMKTNPLEEVSKVRKDSPKSNNKPRQNKIPKNRESKRSNSNSQFGEGLGINIKL